MSALRPALLTISLICALFSAQAEPLFSTVPGHLDMPRPIVSVLSQDSVTHHEDPRLVAALLALTLGPFGAHRLYLGTTAKVPIIYGVTFGGFGILALIDLGHILFTKDLSRFRNNDRVFMWGKPHERTTRP